MGKRERDPDAVAAADDADRAEEAGELRCDFCGQVVPRVRRIALDRDYERLQTPHAVRYACEPCSSRKERRRLDPRRA